MKQKFDIHTRNKIYRKALKMYTKDTNYIGLCYCIFNAIPSLYYIKAKGEPMHNVFPELNIMRIRFIDYMTDFSLQTNGVCGFWFPMHKRLIRIKILEKMISMTTVTYKKWTEEEKDYVKENYYVYSDQALAKHLGRTIDSVSRFRKNNGLHKKMGFVPLHFKFDRA